MKTRRFAAVLTATAMLGGCTTPMSPVEVTRFHLGQVAERGTVAVEPAPGAIGGMEFGMYARAVEQELSRLGWAPVDGVGQSLYVATLDVRTGTRERTGGSPVSIGLGGGTGGFGSGVGGGVSFGLGGGSRLEVGTQIALQLKRRSDQTVVWEGRARGSASERDSDLLAQRLAAALFRDFPGESGRTISVR